MGYTHYFTAEPANAPSDEQWDEITKRFLTDVLPKHVGILCLEYNQPDQPVKVDDEMIFFNGKEEDGHETFVLCRSQDGFGFCKTAEKPYDEAVIETLKIARDVCPGWLELGSDGGDEVFS